MSTADSLPPSLAQKRIAIVQDALAVASGSERFTLSLSRVFPSAPIYTSAYLPDQLFPEFREKEIHTLPFGRRIRTERQFKALFPWWFLTMSALDLSRYDIVVSSANYLAKYINLPARTQHFCFLHNPFRFLWKPGVYSASSVPYNPALIHLIKLFFPLFRKLDVAKTRRIPHVIANSRNTAAQFRAIYGIEPGVIYPPVEVNDFSLREPEDFYLSAGRLISHKKVDLAIEACLRLQRKLIVVGDGLERPALEKLAAGADHIRFLGKVSDAELKDLYARCRALIFPSDEDFGLVPVEVQAAGRPVIAYQSGGALETVVDGETGVFFPAQSVDSLCDAIQRFENLPFSPAVIRKNAMRFDFSAFRDDVLNTLSRGV